MYVIYWILLIFVGFLIIMRVWAQAYVSDRKADEIHYVKTVDGWDIAVHRYRPRMERVGLLPILFCHGLGANRFNFDMDEQHSLALNMAQRGYDVFFLDLRGAGDSQYSQWFRTGKWDIHFSDYVEKDIPAVVDFICSHTGQKKIHWIGHSMGGMVAYAVAQTSLAKKFASFCAVAGPGHFKYLSHFLPMTRLAFFIKPLKVIHASFFAKFYAPILPYLHNVPYISSIFLRENMSPQVLKTAGVNLVTDNPVSLLLEFAQWVQTGKVVNHSGYSYHDNMDKITAPMLLLSGSDDQFAPVDSVRFVYDNISSKDKKHVHFSPENGDHRYGHGDLVVGEPAIYEIWPVIEQWVEDHK